MNAEEILKYISIDLLKNELINKAQKFFNYNIDFDNQKFNKIKDNQIFDLQQAIIKGIEIEKKADLLCNTDNLYHTDNGKPYLDKLERETLSRIKNNLKHYDSENIVNDNINLWIRILFISFFWQRVKIYINEKPIIIESIVCHHSIAEKKEAIERANEKDLNRFKTIFESEIRTPELIQKELDLFYSLFYEKDIKNVPPFVSILNVNHFNQFSIEDIKRIRYAFNEKNRGAIYKDYCLICKPDPLHQPPYLLKYELYYEFLKNKINKSKRAKKEFIKFNIKTEEETERLKDIIDRLIIERCIENKDRTKMLNVFLNDKLEVKIEWNKSKSIALLHYVLKGIKSEFQIDISDKELFEIFEKITSKNNIQSNRSKSKTDSNIVEKIFK